MKDTVIHRIIITLLILVVISVIAVLSFVGYDYYSAPLEERHFHELHKSFKASGLVGHGLGIAGSALIVFGVFSYMLRKRFRIFSRFGVLKHWLEFHIFLCTLGPFLVLFHTTFKFGGIVAVSFWSMVAVFLSGIAGRYIYLQIPHSIEGRELTLSEIEEQRDEMNRILRKTVTLDESIFELTENLPAAAAANKGYWEKWREERAIVARLKSELKQQNIPSGKTVEIVGLFKAQLALKKRIRRLVTMQRLFSYWHVAHLPFALIMLVVMIIHVVVAVTFGYKWIF